MAIHPDKPLVNDKTKAVILAPDGSAATLSTLILTGEEAQLLRSYKKFLNRHGYKEALYCDRCWEQNLQHGTEAYVTDDTIGIRCRCRFTFFQGPTY